MQVSDKVKGNNSRVESQWGVNPPRGSEPGSAFASCFQKIFCHLLLWWSNIARTVWKSKVYFSPPSPRSAAVRLRSIPSWWQPTAVPSDMGYECMFDKPACVFCSSNSYRCQNPQCVSNCIWSDQFKLLIHLLETTPVTGRAARVIFELNICWFQLLYVQSAAFLSHVCQ